MQLQSYKFGKLKANVSQTCQEGFKKVECKLLNHQHLNRITEQIRLRNYQNKIVAKTISKRKSKL